MRRNMDLARAILFELEKCDFTGREHNITVEGYSDKEISYQIRLLNEAGYIEATHNPSPIREYDEWKARTITWDGHDFLDLSRNLGRWEKAKIMAVEKSGELTLTAMKIALAELLRRAFLGNYIHDYIRLFFKNLWLDHIFLLLLSM